MRTYGQYCPIARGAEIFAERWTPIIMRNVLMGCATFTEIQRGAPGIPRSLLTQRLALLEHRGILERLPHPHGRGARYVPTEAGKDLAQVCFALGEWGARWLDVAPVHLDPYVALWSMSNNLAVDRLPDRRVVIRFDFPRQPRKTSRFWLLVEHRKGEVCVTCPGDEDLVITADAEAFVRWQAGRLTWAAATAHDAIRINGPRPLARAFPSWNGPDLFAHIKP
ncbi:MAG TPA: helix-turn-helix domain-containing protein [Mycobacteriales bacterium]|nr:helix-turn-helix domain-containing protein [Mycobacteriales bacterium]